MVHAYSPGDIVWAHMEGYPWWPARVLSRSELVLDAGEPEPVLRGNSVLVLFFNTDDEFATRRPRHLRPFSRAYFGLNRAYCGQLARPLRVAVDMAAANVAKHRLVALLAADSDPLFVGARTGSQQLKSSTSPFDGLGSARCLGTVVFRRRHPVAGCQTVMRGKRRRQSSRLDNLSNDPSRSDSSRSRDSLFSVDKCLAKETPSAPSKRKRGMRPAVVRRDLTGSLSRNATTSPPEALQAHRTCRQALPQTTQQLQERPFTRRHNLIQSPSSCQSMLPPHASTLPQRDGFRGSRSAESASDSASTSDNNSFLFDVSILDSHTRRRTIGPTSGRAFEIKPVATNVVQGTDATVAQQLKTAATAAVPSSREARSSESSWLTVGSNPATEPPDVAGGQGATSAARCVNEPSAMASPGRQAVSLIVPARGGQAASRELMFAGTSRAACVLRACAAAERGTAGGWAGGEAPAAARVLEAPFSLRNVALRSESMRVGGGPFSGRERGTQVELSFLCRQGGDGAGLPLMPGGGALH